MKLVVDTNRIIAAIIKESASRRIIETQEHEFIAPDFSLGEINKHSGEICKKGNLAKKEFDLLISLLFYRIGIIPAHAYKQNMDEAKELLGKRDAKDVPFLALAIAEKADGIWSDDNDFLVQRRIKVYKTKDLVLDFDIKQGAQ